MKQALSRISLSSYALLLTMVFISAVRLTSVNRYETSWDVFGYYLYLPATFVHDDPLLDDRSWVEEMNRDQRLSGTLYQVSENDEGEPMYFFLMGMSVLYLPFFLTGHGIAWATGTPMDGLSEPYQYSLVAGGVFYTLLALWLFHKILKRFFSEAVTAVVLLIIVFATNFSHHMTLKNLETVNMLFLLMCWLIWCTLRWHEEHKLRHMLGIGTAVTLMALVKPSEILAVIIPLMWSVYSISSLKEKWKLILKYKKQILLTLALCLLIGAPQIAYWYVKTGHFFYDSYKNPGVGLDIFHPHLWNILFSFRKGWLIYTPVMLLGLAGLYYLVKYYKPIGASLAVYFLVSFFVISSWTEWWYGAAFSCRPVIISYPILGLGMGVLFSKIKSNQLKWGIGIFASLCLLLNQFQWWQFRNGILEPTRTTAAYYRSVFLKTYVPEGAGQLLSVQRSYTEDQQWTDPEKYRLLKELVRTTDKSWKTDEYLETFDAVYGELTDQDHLWMQVDLEYETDPENTGEEPMLVITALHKDAAYHFRTQKLEDGIQKTYMEYLTPEIRSGKDLLRTYVWNPGKEKMRIRSFTVRFFVRR